MSGKITAVTNLSSNPLFNQNKLKLGTFCSNTIANLTLVPEQWRPTWANCLEAASVADEAGLEAIVPIARWKGYLDGRPEHPSHEVLDVFAWAAGLAQATRYSAILATSHAPTMHPLVVAKQCATIDAISGGRAALNIVGGWNRREFDMFGIDLLEHDQRYVYLEEWLQLLRKLWTCSEEFDYSSRHFRMRGAISRPQPVQPHGIPIMNAAQSPVGIRFSAKNSQIGLLSLRGNSPADWTPQVEIYKKMAREEFGRDIQIWTNASAVLCDTTWEAEAFLHYYSEEFVDAEALDSVMDTISAENNVPKGSPQLAFMRKRMATGAGYPLVGDAEKIADELEAISRAGIDGVIMTWVDYIDGVKRFARDVLPLLEQAGLRKPFQKTG
ncbi:MAG TPA: LLM class flavin-dependent oxidoreductase [Candidatus Acidoferrales bacterium]|nr:LLM class flavin-dependent oxidoreductase [Candidatus Acidoferrales bacterium]